MDLFRRNKLLFVMLTMLVRVLMDIAFVEYITIKWRYIGFTLDADQLKVFISYVAVLFFLGILINYQADRMSHFFCVILFYCMYLPLCTVYAYTNQSSEFFLINSVFFLLFVSIIMVTKKNKQTHDLLPSYTKVRVKMMPLIYLISFCTFIGMTVQNLDNLNFQALINLTNVYEMRGTATYYWGMNYLFSWQTKFINPFMIAISHKNGKRSMKWIYVCFQLWLYVLTGHKMVLFTLLITFIVLFLSSRLSNLPLLLAKGMAAVFSLSIMEFLFFKNSFILDLFIRRTFYVPALLNFHYYDFFNEYGFQYWRHTLLGKVLGINTDYEVAPSFLIGEAYFQNINSNAVTGYIGSEYMNGGYLGVMIATVVLIVLFKAIDTFSLKIPKEIILITLIAPMFNLWNTSFLTALLTGGVTLGVYLLSQTYEKEQKNTQKRFPKVINDKTANR